MATISQEAFGELIRKYTLNMYRLALGILQNEHDAEDAVSEAVLKAYENLGRLRSADKFQAWIMQITANEARKLYGKRKKSFAAEQLEAFLPVFEDEHHEMWETVMQLEQPYREVILLFYYEQFSVSEIARALQIREGTVKSRLSRGRKQLKDMLR